MAVRHLSRHQSHDQCSSEQYPSSHLAGMTLFTSEVACETPGHSVNDICAPASNTTFTAVSALTVLHTWCDLAQKHAGSETAPAMVRIAAEIRTACPSHVSIISNCMFQLTKDLLVCVVQTIPTICRGAVKLYAKPQAKGDESL